MNTKRKVAIFLSLLIAIALSTYLFIQPGKTTETTPDLPEITQEPLEETITTTATLSAIGDILIHGTVYKAAKTEEGYNFDSMFEKVKPFLEASDITVANSESIIGGSKIGVSTYPSFNSPYEVGDALKNAGIDVVSLANNHTLDRGRKAVENAINYWDSIDIAYTGAYLSAVDRNTITTVSKNGIEFSFLSYTYGTNGIPTPQGEEYLVNRIDKNLIQEDLKKAGEQSDVVVLSLHFGNEYQPLPNDEQKDLALFAAENGADIILGHHPHVLQPPEWIETPDGNKSFVIYSLGNFLSGQNEIPRQIGSILHLEIEKTVGPDIYKIDIKNPAFTNTFVKNINYQSFEIDLLKNVHPNLNEETKAHLSSWINDLEFVE